MDSLHDPVHIWNQTLMEVFYSTYLDEDLDKHDFILLDRVPNFFDHFLVHNMNLHRALSIINNAITAN